MNINREKVTALVGEDKTNRLVYWCRIITLLPVLIAFDFLEAAAQMIDLLAFHLLDSHFKEVFASHEQSEAPCRELIPNPTKTELKTERRTAFCQQLDPPP